MKVSIIIFCLLLICSVRAEVKTDGANHVEWVHTALTKMQTIKAGMTRGDMEKLFMPDGGISTVSHQTFVYRECPYFKVDVDFIPAPHQGVSMISSRDRISKISKPYLEQPNAD